MTQPPQLDAEHAAFIEGGVSILVASRLPGNVPTLERARGCRVSDDHRRVTVWLAQRQSAELLGAIRDTRVIAAVFSQPTTHRTLQVKGSDAVVRPAGAHSAAVTERLVREFAAEVAAFGFTQELVRAVLWCDPAELVEVSFTVAEAFMQTPGPRAGTPLGVRP